MSSEEGAVLHETQAGEVIMLGASTTLTVLSPAGDAADWESNNSSIVVKVSYGEIDFMLTGDAGVGIEEYLIEEYGEALDSEVLKLGHHGSRTSTAERFLQVVSPEYAVVSAGKDNRYGHPHTEVVEKVADYGSEIVSTAEQGTIIFKTDGENVWLE
jgi:competence protein ComEC